MSSGAPRGGLSSVAVSHGEISSERSGAGRSSPTVGGAVLAWSRRDRDQQNPPRFWIIRYASLGCPSTVIRPKDASESYPADPMGWLSRRV